MAEEEEKTTLRDVMSRWLVTASPSDDVEKAAELMAKGQVRRLPVVKDGELVGMVSRGDIATAENQRPQAAMALEHISENIRRL